jgi:hypothetical protein
MAPQVAHWSNWKGLNRLAAPPGSTCATLWPKPRSTTFSNTGEATEYRVILDSESAWTFNLHSSGYDISLRDTTNLLDLSDRGSNTLKLYVTGDTAQLYMNGHYIDTLDLVMLGLGQSSEATHDVMVCAGIREEYAAVGRLTRYEGFRVWSLP